MTSLANVIRDEAKALEAIALAPLPDSSFLDAAECSHKDGKQGNLRITLKKGYPKKG
jgi:hypothetical protein